MPPPLTDNQVEYADGTKATVHQMAEDVTAFLAWAAQPELETRRNLGVKVMIFLSFFTLLMYCLMRRTWRKIKMAKEIKFMAYKTSVKGALASFFMLTHLHSAPLTIHSFSKTHHFDVEVVC